MVIFFDAILLTTILIALCLLDLFYLDSADPQQSKVIPRPPGGGGWSSNDWVKNTVGIAQN